MMETAVTEEGEESGEERRIRRRSQERRGWEEESGEEGTGGGVRRGGVRWKGEGQKEGICQEDGRGQGIKGGVRGEWGSRQVGSEDDGVE